MSKILIKDPKKMNMCDACKVPKASQKEVDAFLIQLRAHGFDTAAVNDVSKMIKSGGVSSTGRGFGPKTRRLCALAICSSLVLVSIGASRSVIQDILIKTGYLPELCSTNFLVRLGHDFIAKELQDWGIHRQTCEEKAMIWRAAVDGLLTLVMATGITVGSIRTNFKKTVSSIEELLEEWTTKQQPLLQGTSSPLLQAPSSRSSSPGPGAAKAAVASKKSGAVAKKSAKKHSSGSSSSGSRGEKFSQAIKGFNALADRNAPPEQDFKMGKIKGALKKLTKKKSSLGSSLGSSSGSSLGSSSESKKGSKKGSRKGSRKGSVKQVRRMSIRKSSRKSGKVTKKRRV